AGTDGGNAIALHRELEIFHEAGIPANEVLKIATYNPAKAFGLEKQYGQIKKGMKADFILIDGNPAVNISDIRRVEFVELLLLISSISSVSIIHYSCS
ncbi:MAG: amidohydrolase family protein, partial [Chitinophagaceae bacterium]